MLLAALVLLVVPLAGLAMPLVLLAVLTELPVPLAGLAMLTGLAVLLTVFILFIAFDHRF